MGPQATAELDETATPEQTDAQFDADMLSAFADDEPGPQSTTSPAEESDASAKPDAPETSTTDTPETTEAEVNDLASAVRRINDLEAKGKQSGDSSAGRMDSIEQILKGLQAATGG